MHAPQSQDSNHHIAKNQLNLSRASKGKIRTAILRSLAPATLRSYQSTVQLFHAFCDREQIPPKARTPTPEILLCAFAADGIERLSGNTTRNRLTALKAWHAFNNWPWHGSDRLTMVVNGVNDSAPSGRRPERLPVTLQALETLASHLNPQDSLDIAVLACACTAFWGQCRLGELLPTSSRSFNSTLLPRRRSIRHSPGNNNTWVLNLPSTKTNRHGQDIPLVRQKGPSNPLRALYNHLQTNKNPLHMPLFTFTAGKDLVVLTEGRFLERCNQIWSHAGFPVLTGHSFRIGGTTHLLLSGVPPDVVQTTGRWSSDAFLRYWRSSEHIAPIYPKDTSTSTSTSRIYASLPNARHRHRG